MAVAKDHGRSVKDSETYQAQRGGGAIKENGDRSGRYADRTKDDLSQRAREIGNMGRSDMTKSELIEALRKH